MLFNELSLFGIVIKEPGTIISDLIMGTFCIVLFAKLLIRKEFHNQKYFSQFFLFLGFSSIVAAFAHGLFHYFGIYLHKVSWILSGFALYFLQLGSSSMFNNPKFKSKFIIYIKFQLLTYLVLLMFTEGFLIVKINYALTLIGVLAPIFTVDMIKNNFKHNLYILIGIFLAIIPSIFHRTPLNFLYIFNMNDLSHFFLILCIFFLFLGVKERFYELPNLKDKLPGFKKQ
ncbi:MAG: hypothetical protein C0596_03210 [Marinilabiliales bacterium]|nr:MAG: hypothetical protein C0596_03210 [Marinilabiliales bacterium]